MNLQKDKDDVPEAEKPLFDQMCKEQYKSLIRERLSEEVATVFSNSRCPYCPKAKDLLKRNNVGFSEVILDHLNPNDQMEIANCIFGMKQRYVPYIYMDNKRVGSYGELWDMHQTGVLKDYEPTTKREKKE